MRGGSGVEEPLQIGLPPRTLEAGVVVPPGARAGAVLCHPHPLYGGDMDNGVVVAVAEALVAEGLAVLRFNFGGVGRSGGAYDDGNAEVDDARTAVAALRTRLPGDAWVALVGYSFGAWVALRASASVERVVAIAPPLAMLGDRVVLPRVPLAFVTGTRDVYCPLARVEAVAPPGTLHTIAGADHFLAGREGDVARTVVRILTTAG